MNIQLPELLFKEILKLLRLFESVILLAPDEVQSTYDLLTVPEAVKQIAICFICNAVLQPREGHLNNRSKNNVVGACLIIVLISCKEQSKWAETYLIHQEMDIQEVEFEKWVYCCFLELLEVFVERGRVPHCLLRV